jgi:hypothetical protein
MHNSDLAEQLSYLNQRLNSLASQISNIKSSKTLDRHRHVEIHDGEQPSARNTVKIEQIPLSFDESSRGRGRPTGPAKLYSLNAAYKIFVERGIIVKRGRGRPRKAS